MRNMVRARAGCGRPSKKYNKNKRFIEASMTAKTMKNNAVTMRLVSAKVRQFRCHTSDVVVRMETPGRSRPHGNRR